MNDRRPRPYSSWLRMFHVWGGAVFAPAILFFAVSGFAQVFSLHKAQPAIGYRPPALIQALGQLHKVQSLRAAHDAGAPREGHGRRRHGEEATADQDPSSEPAPRPVDAGRQALKLYSAATSGFIALTTLAGLTLALRSRRDRTTVLALLAAGTLIPLALLMI